MPKTKAQLTAGIFAASAVLAQTACAPGADTDRALKSCYKPDFDPRTENTFISLDSPAYPAVSNKIDRIGDDNPDNLALVLMAGKFATLGGVDIFVPVLTMPCTYGAYDSDGCQAMSKLLANSGTLLDDIKLDGDTLSYTLAKRETGETYEVVFGDRDFNQLSLTKHGDEVTTHSHWTRDTDGTEHLVSKSSDGNQTSYTERPDCSGQAKVVKAEDGEVKRTTQFKWTSAKKKSVQVQYTGCDYSGGKSCASGSF